MYFSTDSSDYVFVFETFWHFEFFTEYVELAVASDKAYEMDIAIFQGQVDSLEGDSAIQFADVNSFRCDILHWCFPLKRGAAVVVVAKILEIPGLAFQMFEVGKELFAVKHLIKNILEFFDGTVSPWFSDRNEVHLDTQSKAHAQY